MDMATEIRTPEDTVTRKSDPRAAPCLTAGHPANPRVNAIAGKAIKRAALVGWLAVPLSAAAQLVTPPLPPAGQVGSSLRTSADAPLPVGASMLTSGVKGNLLFSNNLDLRPDGAPTGHWLLEAAPYVNYRALTIRGPLNLSGSLRAQFRDGDSDAFRVRGLFSGSTDLRLIDDWLNLSARGSTQTVNLDPFRSSSADPGAQTGNTGSLKDFEVSPYLRGKFDGEGSWDAAYRIRYIDLSNAPSLASLYATSPAASSVCQLRGVRCGPTTVMVLITRVRKPIFWPGIG
jgi:hypothetical protein